MAKGISAAEEAQFIRPLEELLSVPMSHLLNLSLDSFVNLFTFLDTVSLLRFHGVVKLSRNLTDITSIWTNRWMWKNGNLLESFPMYFFHDFTKLKFVKNRSSDGKIHQIDDRKVAKSMTEAFRVLDNEQISFSKDSQRAYEFDIPGNLNKLKADFVKFRNVDVIILKTILKISVDLLSFSDLTDFFVYNSASKNSNTMFYNPEDGTIRTTNSDVSYFHSLYLLTIIIDQENETYSKEMRINFLKIICGDLKCRDLVYFNENTNHKFSDKFDMNNSLVDTILCENSIYNIARTACLYVRSQVQFFKWNEVLDHLIPEYNRSPEYIENKKNNYNNNHNMHKMKNGRNEHGVGESRRFGEENNLLNIGKKMVVKEVVVEEEKRNTLQEGFMIIADAKVHGSEAFCDRSYVRDIINAIVSVVHREIFKDLVFRCPRNVLKAKVSRMDRTEVCGIF